MTTPKIQSPDSLPWDPNNDIFPLRKDLPKKIPYHASGVPEDAAWVWGRDDYKGRLNLLTPQRVLSAARSEIRTGETVRLDLPLHIPTPACFNRSTAVHRIVDLGGGVAFDDIVDNRNPQAGSQWDGFRHMCHLASGSFYNGTKSTDILPKQDPNGGESQQQHDPDSLKCSIHHWSSSSSSPPTTTDSVTRQSKTTTNGISARAILLDYWTYAQSTPGKSYDPFTGHSIPFDELLACAKYQGINILPTSQGGDIQVGDILVIRSGWVDRYHSLDEKQREVAAQRPTHIFQPEVEKGEKGETQEFAGLAQDHRTLTWLHDCYFAAVAGDAPGFERWPSLESGPNRDGNGGWLLHEYILALWGMPIGEMWDLEQLAAVCRRNNRWTFFLTSAPDMVYGGVSSKPNATAIF